MKAPARVRLLVADDHPVVLRGLRELLEELGMVVEREAASAEEVIAAAGRGGLDALVLDFAMPGAHGVDLVRRLAQEHPALPVLVLSIHPEEQLAIPCLKAGAAGYLSKSCAPEELAAAIREVVDGRKYLSPRVANELVRLAPGEPAPPHETLSGREREVFRRLASGEAVGEIAETLGLSVKTVSTYRARVLEKLSLRTNADLVRYAHENHLVAPTGPSPRV